MSRPSSDIDRPRHEGSEHEPPDLIHLVPFRDSRFTGSEAGEEGAATMTIEGPAVSPAVTSTEGPGRAGQAQRRSGPALVIAGLLATAVAAIGIAAGSSGTPGGLLATASGRNRPVLSAGPGGSGLGLGAPSSTDSAVLIAYVAGQTSGWHRHAGWHEVAVVSGTLTVYTDDCRPRAYGTGDRYVGGPERHRVTNEGSEPVQVAVRWAVHTGADLGELTVPQDEPEECRDAGVVPVSTQPSDQRSRS